MKRLFCLLFLLLFVSQAYAATGAEFPDPGRFPLPEEYDPNVRFWMNVYGEWSESEMAIHDSANMDIVFDVVRISENNDLLRTVEKVIVRERVEEIRKILMDLHSDPAARVASKDHQKFFDFYAKIAGPNKFRNAAENLRVQQGIKERFKTGLERMTLYLDSIKKVFREEGLPDELAYLPLVESSFNNESVSKTRAAGIWQFMSGTARSYMKVNSDVDERYDPMTATRGAARYLKRSYQMFGNWPVSLMSYNHGQQGMRNAVNSMGTADFMTIVKNYKGKYFGFASRNFYAEYLAACKVMHNSDKYFSDINYSRPLRFDSIRLARPLWVSTIVKYSQLTREDLRQYNPALQSSVLYSRRSIPAGYNLHLPAGRYGDLPEFIASLRKGETPGQKKTVAVVAQADRSKSSSTPEKTYVVKKGDTLFSISRKFSTSVESLRKMNRLSHNNIFPGQRLYIGAR